ncbi:hypothetical protein F2P81_003832 [Scophthalmus maximus]|uniref:Uncharacterized protein n=1 Tax=Scophthalmus maximus TaxID=52904 RepID=A0A6A4TN50_SCOMX|nr:hypothetical protein F2P81_003832 [Scophthalmus maximus]
MKAASNSDRVTSMVGSHGFLHSARNSPAGHSVHRPGPGRRPQRAGDSTDNGEDDKEYDSASEEPVLVGLYFMRCIDLLCAENAGAVRDCARRSLEGTLILTRPFLT